MKKKIKKQQGKYRKIVIKKNIRKNKFKEMQN